MDKIHLTEEQLNNPIIHGWIKQKELNLDDVASNEVLPKIIPQAKSKYVYAWITPVKYNTTKLHGWILDNTQPDTYAYFYLAKAQGDGFFMEATATFDAFYSFSSEKAALKARKKAIQFLQEEMASGIRFVIPNDYGINSLLVSKHLELLNKCKLYKIKISNRTSWKITEVNDYGER